MPRPSRTKTRPATRRQAASEPTPPPTPSAYRAAWYPVQVTLPDGTLHRLAKVFAAAEGLYVYASVPADPVATPTWYAPIDFDKTVPPRSSYATRQKNIRITTASGDVVLSPLPHCGCGQALKMWRPSWAHRNEAWS